MSLAKETEIVLVDWNELSRGRMKKYLVDKSK